MGRSREDFMYATNRIAFFGGLAMILLAIGIVVAIGTTIPTTDKSPFTRSEVPQFLKDVHDDQTLYIINGADGMIVDGALSVVVAAVVYILFRDRSRLLALIAFAGLLGQAGISLLLDLDQILLTIVAKDFVTGGPGNIPAGDASLLEVGRYLGMLSLALTNVIFTMLGVGLLALGWLIARAPAGAVNPPRWLGWMAILAGASGELAWLLIVLDPAFVFLLGNFVFSLIFLVGLGIWLLQHQDIQPAATTAAA